MNRALYSLKGKCVWVAGHRGTVGSALLRRLAREDCVLLTVERKDLDLTRQKDVEQWMGRDPAAGGLPRRGQGWRHRRQRHATPVRFFTTTCDSLNVIHAAADVRVEKLLFLGSSCIYPKFAPQPIAEDAPSDRAARAHQRVVRDRQDCGT